MKNIRKFFDKKRLILVFVWITSAILPVPGQHGPKVTEAPTESQFNDLFPGTRITSDGCAVYLQDPTCPAVAKVEGGWSHFFTGENSSHDWVQQLNFTRPQRNLYFNFDGARVTDPNGGVSSDPTLPGPITGPDDVFINVRTLGALFPWNSTTETGASGYTKMSIALENGSLRFNPEKYPGTDQVFVERRSPIEWRISAFPPDPNTLSEGNSVAVFTVSKKNQTLAQGYYQIPVQFVVRCLDATNCPR